MPTVPLPDNPDLDQLRRQARELLRAARGGEPDALTELGSPGRPPRLRAAQRALARRYGFPDWTGLARHIDLRRHYSRFPRGAAEVPTADPVADFLRLACLTYTDDQPGRWARAARLLAERPEISTADVPAAAAAADVPALRRLLAADPGSACRDAGPYRIQPLCYLAYARHDPAIPADAVLAAARLLLDAGADPNAGYLWHGLPTPFTVLTGVFGEGEQGPERQPRHPHSPALAELLLDAGADPNDGQVLYNRMFGPDDDHLELLLRHGLGRGDGGPWRRRLGTVLDPPAMLLSRQLSWAVTHGMTDRVRLLLSHGADPDAPLPGGRTPASLAATTGRRAVLELLVGHGATRPDLPALDAFVAAALAADGPALTRLRARDPDALAAARSARPGLIVWAAATGSIPAVELLADLGFDVNAMARSDIPAEQPWQTALHTAAETGNAPLAHTLLRLGADPTRPDARFHSTPLSWAHHFHHPAVAAALTPPLVPIVDHGRDVAPSPPTTTSHP